MNKKYKLHLVAFFLVSTIVFVSALFWFQASLIRDLDISTYTTLTELSTQQSQNFYSKIKYEFNMLKVMASTVTILNERNLNDVVSQLGETCGDVLFEQFCISDTTGNAVASDLTSHNDKKKDFFIKALQGQANYSEPYLSQELGNYVITIAMPVYKDGKVTNVLSATYQITELNMLLDIASFGGNGYGCIVDKNGELITKEQNRLVSPSSSDFYNKYSNNLFNFFANCDFKDEDSFETVKRNISLGKDGITKYEYDDIVRLSSYQPLHINDWYLFSVVSNEVINAQTNKILSRTYVLAGVLIVLFVLLIIYMLSSKKSDMKKLQESEFVDALTSSFNKRKFNEKATELINSASGKKYAFLILDIDKFKVLNDTLGYDCGDKLLICIADAIRESLYTTEIFGRCESDEYNIMLEYESDKVITKRAEKLIKKINDEFKTKMDNSYNLVLCVGVYVVEDKSDSINSICDRAKHAHWLIKGAQASSVSFYNAEIRNKILEEKLVENKMHDALINKEFKLFLQPKYRLDTETVCGAEALVRWSDGESIVMYPNQFIPVFEKNGFITKLDSYMLETACAFIRDWIDNGNEPIPISINFSRLHLKDADFVDSIARIVEKHGIPPKLIEIELTESTMLNNEDVLIGVLSHLHEHGFSLSMDDFGSGYSSLGLLKNLPVDIIKLDRTFFTQYNDIDRAKTVIESVISMAEKLGIETVAEGVEEKEHIELLRELGCDIVQGYYYAKPMPSSDLDSFLSKNKDL